MTDSTYLERFKSKYIQGSNSSCWLWSAGTCKDGYGRFQLDGKARKAHRIAWELENGPIPGGLCVLHHCDTPACVNPRHLFLGTNKDNVEDRQRKNRQSRGRKHSLTKARLTEDQVQDIKILEGLISQRCIAKRYNVSKSLIGLIMTGQRWGFV